MDVLLYKHLRIFGTVMKSRPPEVKQAMVRRFAQRWLPALAAGTIRPVIDSTWPLAEAAQAHRRMESGQSVGKLLLLPQGAQ
jgi:NADPH:quinone reductase-like Zn-dependent oxidoreductase